MLAIASCATLLALLAVMTLGYRGLNSQVSDLKRQVAAGDQARSQDTKQIADLAGRVDALGAKVKNQAGKLTQAQEEMAQPATAKVARTASPSVFTVYAGDFLGSGFIVSSTSGQSELITNFHVVAEEYNAGGRTVDLKQRGTTYSGEIVDVSQANDLALIRINESLPKLELANARAEIGDPVVVLGSPNGLAGTVTSGIVSSYRALDAADYLQFSAPISPGNSGGPVLDQTGRVLGVAVMKDVRDNTEGISYAIPTDRVCLSLDVC